jgi:hypothetical protein
VKKAKVARGFSKGFCPMQAWSHTICKKAKIIQEDIGSKAVSEGVCTTQAESHTSCETKGDERISEGICMMEAPSHTRCGKAKPVTISEGALHHASTVTYNLWEGKHNE